MRAVFCDVGGVLTPPPVQAAAEYVTGHGVSLDEVTRAVARHARRHGRNPLVELELGQVTEGAFLTMVADAIRRHLGRNVDVQGFSDHYFAGVTLNHELLEHLESHRAAGIRLGVLSNNAREWHERWLAMPEFDIFEVFVNSALVGMRKPDPAIYRLAAHRLELPPSTCAFLDDLEVNCEGARAVGMTAVRFINTADAIASLDRVLTAGGSDS